MIQLHDPDLEIHCITLDKRLADGKVDIFGKLGRYGILPSLYLVGDGKIFGSGHSGPHYAHIDMDPPGIDQTDELFRKKRQSYNYGLCVLDILDGFVKNPVPSRFLWLLEDDAELNEPKFQELWNTCWEQLFFAQMDSWFDVLYIGGNHIDGEIRQLEVHSGDQIVPLPNIIRTASSLDLHSVVFSHDGAKKILTKSSNPNHTFDGIINDMQRAGELKVLAFHPSLITQKAGFSYNEFREVDRAGHHFL